MSATESASTATSKENDSKMYTREFDLEDKKHSSEGANTLPTKVNLQQITILCSKS